MPNKDRESGQSFNAKYTEGKFREYCFDRSGEFKINDRVGLEFGKVVIRVCPEYWKEFLHTDSVGKEYSSKKKQATR